MTVVDEFVSIEGMWRLREFRFPGPFGSVDEIKAANRTAGRGLFDRDTMRVFQPVADQCVFGGRCFVVSERVPFAERRWSICVASDDGSVTTVGWQAFGSLAEARRVLVGALTRLGVEV